MVEGGVAGYRPAPLRIYGVVAQQRHLPRKVQVFLDFVAQQIAASGEFAVSEAAQ